MRRCIPLAALAALIILPSIVFAGRVKVFSYPKKIAAGQLAIIIFENPNYEATFSKRSCTAEKLLAFKQMEVPIIRIDQRGKQIFTQLGSYQTSGDSMIATFMVPVGLDAGDASLYVLNGNTPSVPYKFTVTQTAEVLLLKVEGSLRPLEKFKLVGEGFVPSEILESGNQIGELRSNIGYDKLTRSDQYTALNKRMQPDWARVETGNFLFIEQGSKKWQIFVEGCDMSKEGMMLEFTAPPDLTPGEAKFSLAIRSNKTELARSSPLAVTVQ